MRYAHATTILIGILVVLLAYLIWHRLQIAEGFADTPPTIGAYYTPLKDTMFGQGDAYYEDGNNEVFILSLDPSSYNDTTTNAYFQSNLSSFASIGKIATIAQLRKELGYGLDSSSGALICKPAMAATDDTTQTGFVYAMVNASSVGINQCGRVSAEKAEGDCSGGCVEIVAEDPSGVSIFMYGTKPSDTTTTITTADKSLKFNVLPFNSIENRKNRKISSTKKETFVVYDVSGDTGVDASKNLQMTICSAFGAVPAGIQQVKVDQATPNNGSNWKRAGWLRNDTTLKAVYPINEDSGTTGLAATQCPRGSGGAEEPCVAGVYQARTVQGAKNPDGTFTYPTITAPGVICYGTKPEFSKRDKIIGTQTFRAEFYNTFRKVWSKYEPATYKCVVSDLTQYNTDPEKNYMRRALKYVQLMQQAGAKLTLGTDNPAGCSQGIYGDDGENCWACARVDGTKGSKPPAAPKSESGQWKSIGDTIDTAVDLTDRSLDVTTANGRNRLKKGIQNIMACQAAGGAPTLGANTAYPGCGDGWCCAPNTTFTLNLGALGGAEAAGECEPQEPPCIPPAPTARPAGGDGRLKKKCTQILSPTIAQKAIRDPAKERDAILAGYYAKVKPTLMRDVVQQMKADKLFKLATRPA